jgi:hypothetical protein
LIHAFTASVGEEPFGREVGTSDALSQGHPSPATPAASEFEVRGVLANLESRGEGAKEVGWGHPFRIAQRQETC